MRPGLKLPQAFLKQQLLNYILRAIGVFLPHQEDF